MAISAHFTHRGFTAEKYEEAGRRLNATGLGAPAGMLHHFALDADGEIEVFDIWESQEALEQFGQDVFIPILLELGVELQPPTIRRVHNGIQN